MPTKVRVSTLWPEAFAIPSSDADSKDATPLGEKAGEEKVHVETSQHKKTPDASANSIQSDKVLKESGPTNNVSDSKKSALARMLRRGNVQNRKDWIKKK